MGLSLVVDSPRLATSRCWILGSCFGIRHGRGKTKSPRAWRSRPAPARPTLPSTARPSSSSLHIQQHLHEPDSPLLNSHTVVDKSYRQFSHITQPQKNHKRTRLCQLKSKISRHLVSLPLLGPTRHNIIAASLSDNDVAHSISPKTTTSLLRVLPILSHEGIRLANYTAM